MRALEELIYSMAACGWSTITITVAPFPPSHTLYWLGDEHIKKLHARPHDPRILIEPEEY